MAIADTPGFGPVCVSHAAFWPPETTHASVPEGLTAPAAPLIVAVKVTTFPRLGAAGAIASAIEGVA